MKNTRLAVAGLILTACVSIAQAQSVRPEVGKPLQQAGELLRAGKAKEALAKVHDADAVSGKTAGEQLLIDRMRGAAAQRAGDNATAVRSFEAVFASGKLSGAEQAQTAESLAFSYSQLRDWPKTMQWAQKAQALGNNSAQIKQLISYVQSQSGDYNAIAKQTAAAVAAAEAAGNRPSENDLLTLADAYQRTGNHAGYGATLEKLLANYPKKDYWAIYLARLQSKPGFSDRFSLDLMRLKLATGNLTKAEDYMEMSQLALQEELPAEGLSIVNKGFDSGVLGSGAEADRQKRLRDLAIKQDAAVKAKIANEEAQAKTASTGADLVKVGTQYASMGQADKAVALIEAGIAKGGLKRPEDAKLRLGIAMVQSGKNKAKAIQVLRSVQGTDGVADIAHLWIILANRG
jgi:hypothetical protein